MLLRLLLVLASVCVLAPPALAQYTRISISTAGVQADGASSNPSVSDDARFVAFSSTATNFVSGDTNSQADIYLHDRDTDADGVFDEADARSTVRVSVTTGGGQFQSPCVSPVVSGDGRYVAFLTNAPLPAGVGPVGGTGGMQIVRWDRVTGALDVVSQTAAGALGNGDSDSVDMSNDGRLVIFRSSSTNFVAGDQGGIANIFLRDMQTGSIVRLGTPQPAAIPFPSPSHPNTNRYTSPSLSGDGRIAAFTRVESPTFPGSDSDQGHLFIANLETGEPAVEVADEIRARLSDDGRDLMVMGFRNSDGTDLARRRRATNERLPGFGGIFRSLTPIATNGRVPSFVMGQDGRYGASVIETASPASLLYDLFYERTFPLPFSGSGGSFDASGRYLAVVTQSVLAPPADADTNSVADIYVVDLPRVFDADSDTLDDRWETTFRLSTTSGADADGPMGDPDNDGVTNAAELAAGTHPRGLVRQYLAEGATGSFFSTTLALVNPKRMDSALDASARAVVTFLRPGEAPVHAFTHVP